MSLTNSISILDALNVKYLIFETEGGSVSVVNPNAYGNAWFVNNIKKVSTADDELKAIQNINLKNSAVCYDQTIGSKSYFKDSLATIKLEVHKPNYIQYTSKNSNKGLAVFSEIYYPKGWNVYIDKEPSTHFRANFVLRAMEIPAGTHIIEFKFEPQVVKTGSIVSLISFLIMVSLLGYFIFVKYRKPKNI
jgi:uncharacterized membrane protein YfhO